MNYRLGSRSMRNLFGVHPDLARVVTSAIAITEVDFTVLEGLRSETRQRRLVDSGASTTMNSRHLTGHAVDLGAYVDNRVAWDWPLYHKIAWAMKVAAGELGVDMSWGGDWVTFKDGPHFELSRMRYPA